MAQKNENVVSMEKELFVRQVTKRGSGQASRDDQGQPAEIEQTSKASFAIHETIKTIPREEKLKKIREAAEEEESAQHVAKPKIQRVPRMLRDQTNSDRYYKPRVAAFGPFHHGKPEYEQAQKIKYQLAAKFIRDSVQNETALLEKVEEKIKVLRECYDEEATKDYDDEDLAWMLLVDGCSMLEFIYKHRTLECFKIKRDRVAFVEQDMFLLENQLPYELLKLLMSSSSKKEALEKSIKFFVQKMHAPFEMPKSQATPKSEQKPQPRQHPEVVKVTIEPEPEQEPEPTHLLELLLTTMLGRQPNNTRETRETRETSVCTIFGKLTKFWKTASTTRDQSFRNVQELQAAGIYFSPSVLGDIHFKSFLCCGFLYLPKIRVDDSMGPKFMNLIAYEMCPDFQNEFGVTSFIGFLDSLIDGADDVKHLRKKHILQNLLGSDEEVAQLFNEIGRDLVPNDAIYINVKSKIEAHYQTKWKKWMAQFFHDHFSSPWTFLAFIGVLFGLGMTAVQTWYTVNSDDPPSPCEALLEYLKARG